MENKFKHLKLKFLSDEYKYATFENRQSFLKSISDLLDSGMIFSASFDSSSLSLICPVKIHVNAMKEEAGWKIFKIEGDMPFGTVQGLISKISSTLIERGVGVCVISTYDTDIFLIRSKNLQLAKESLEDDGWELLS